MPFITAPKAVLAREFKKLRLKPELVTLKNRRMGCPTPTTMVIVYGTRTRLATKRLADKYGSCVPADETPDGEARIKRGTQLDGARKQRKR
jgi:hypothetical protein